MRIVFVGMPGAGKSTWAKKIASYTGFQFTDLDRYIENESGKTIAEIFNLSGEEFFRQLETEFLIQWLNSAPPNAVLATGGGTPCFNNNMELLHSAGALTVLLDLSPNALVGRISGSKHKRPLFSDLDEYSLREKVMKLREERWPFYALAKLKITARNHFTAKAMKKAVLEPLNLMHIS